MTDPATHLNGEGVDPAKLVYIPWHIDGVVLDAGSGITEPYRDHLASRAKDYVSLDIRPGAMVQADVLDLTYTDQTFAYCWASELLEHLGGPTEAATALRELQRVARHGCATWPTPVHTNFRRDPGHTDPEIEPSFVTAKGEAVLIW